MKILITGGSGFIGQSFIQKYDHHDYILIDKLKSKISVATEISRAIEDLSDDELDELIFKVDVVIHLAAEKLHNNAMNQTLYESNITSTFRICNSILRSKKNIKLLFTSSLYAYGSNGKAKKKLTENQAVGNFTLYGTSKFLSEHLIKTLLNENQNYHIIRLFFAYGPKQLSSAGYKSVMRKSIELLHAGNSAQIYGSGNAKLDYIYIDDVTNFIEGTITNHYQYRLVNLGSGRGYEIGSVIKKICRLFGAATQFEYMDQDWTEGTYRVANTTILENQVGFACRHTLDFGINQIIKAY